MKVESCIMYMWYKFRPTTTVLTNLAGIPVTDVNGIIMHCSGSWNDPGKCMQFTGSLYCIHIASKQSGLYCEMCDECHDLPVSEQHKGCDSHVGTPFVLTSGSPQTNLTFINASERIKNKLAGYVPEQSSQLLPCHVHKIRTCLVSTYSLVDLQTMVMIMVRTCLFSVLMILTV